MADRIGRQVNCSKGLKYPLHRGVEFRVESQVDALLPPSERVDTTCSVWESVRYPIDSQVSDEVSGPVERELAGHFWGD